MWEIGTSQEWGKALKKIAKWTLPAELTIADPGPAADLLKEYFTAVNEDGSPVKSGAKFETFAGGGDRPDIAGVVTAEDVLAVSLLSVHVPGDAVLRLLGSNAGGLAKLLTGIPANLELVNAGDSDIGPDSDAEKLWTAVRRSGVGPVTTSKLLARKRPQLLPVIDTVVKEMLKHPARASFWVTLQEHLKADDGRLQAHLVAARGASGIDPQVSVIRCFDVVVWMLGKRAGLGVGRGRY